MVGSFSYTPRHGICVFVRSAHSADGEFLLHAPCCNLSCRLSKGESQTIRAAICLVDKRIKRFVCVRSADSRSLLTPRDRICLVVRRALRLAYTHHAENCLVFRQMASISNKPLAIIFPVFRRLGYTPRAGESVLSLFGKGVSLTRPVMQSVSSLSGSGVSLTRTALKSVSSFVGWGVSLHAPC